MGYCWVLGFAGFYEFNGVVEVFGWKVVVTSTDGGDVGGSYLGDR